MNLRKLWPALGLMCVAAISTASADTYNSRSDSHQTKGSGTYERGTYREITPNAGPRVAAGADVFLTADFIYWKTEAEGTDYAATGTNFGISPAVSALTNASSGKLKTYGDDWSPGFKVGIGLNLSHDGWDLYAQYTWLRPSNTTSLSTSTAGTIQPSQPLADGNVDLVNGERASASWDFDLNVIDFELGRNFYLSQFLTMRPFIGLKATWQDNDATVKYFADSFTYIDGSTSLDGPYTVRKEDDMWGIGVRGGFNISWYMAKSWSFYGDLAWTAMWADFDSSNKETIGNPSAAGNGLNPVTLVNTNNNDYYGVKNILEIELGLRWQIWFNDDNYHFSLQAGWEEQVWVNWLINAGTIWNDLSFHGLNLKARFDF